jgi:hypothetical protein
MWMKRALLAGSLIASLCLGEGILQVYYRASHGRWLRQENLGFRVGSTMPVPDRREYTLRPGFTDDVTRINGLGFRGELIPVGTPDPLVCVIGDSVPFGFSVADHLSYPARLDWILRREASGARVLNAGVPSYTLRQSFDRLRLEVEPRYAPRLVVVHAANDISLLTHYGKRWNADRTWADVRMRESWGPRTGLDDFVSYRFLSHRLAPREEEATYPYHPPEELLAHLDAVLGENLDRLEERGVPVVLVAIGFFSYAGDTDDVRNAQLRQWRRWHPFHRHWKPIADRINLLLQSHAERRRDVYYFDLPDEMDRAQRDDFFIDVIHLSARGADFTAGRLRGFIAAHAPLEAALGG